MNRPVTISREDLERAEIVVIQLHDPVIAHLVADDFRDAGFTGTTIFLQPGEDIGVVGLAEK